MKSAAKKADGVTPKVNITSVDNLIHSFENVQNATSGNNIVLKVDSSNFTDSSDDVTGTITLKAVNVANNVSTGNVVLNISTIAPKAQNNTYYISDSKVSKSGSGNGLGNDRNLNNTAKTSIDVTNTKTVYLCAKDQYGHNIDAPASAYAKVTGSAKDGAIAGVNVKADSIEIVGVKKGTTDVYFSLAGGLNEAALTIAANVKKDIASYSLDDAYIQNNSNWSIKLNKASVENGVITLADQYSEAQINLPFAVDLSKYKVTVEGQINSGKDTKLVLEAGKKVFSWADDSPCNHVVKTGDTDEGFTLETPVSSDLITTIGVNANVYKAGATNSVTITEITIEALA